VFYVGGYGAEGFRGDFDLPFLAAFSVYGDNAFLCPCMGVFSYSFQVLRSDTPYLVQPSPPFVLDGGYYLVFLIFQGKD
jgi:hypothetical protein